MKVGRWNPVNEYVNHNGIKWSWLKVCQIEYNCFSLETAGSIEVIFHVEPAQNKLMKLW